MSEFVVQFLTRPGCHLCDEARLILEAATGGIDIGIKEVDIESSDRLTRDYGLRIPVVLAPDGEVLAEGIFERRKLRRQIRKLAATFRRS